MNTDDIENVNLTETVMQPEVELPPADEAPEGFYTQAVSDDVKQRILKKLRGETITEPSDTLSDTEELISNEIELPPANEAPEGFYTPPVSDEIRKKIFKKLRQESADEDITSKDISPANMIETTSVITKANEMAGTGRVVEPVDDSVIPEECLTAAIPDSVREEVLKRIKATVTEEPVKASSSYDDSDEASRYVEVSKKSKKPVIFIAIALVILILLLLKISKCNRTDNNYTSPTESYRQNTTQAPTNAAKPDEELSSAADNESGIGEEESITEVTTDNVISTSPNMATTKEETALPTQAATETRALESENATTKSSTQSTTKATMWATTKAATQATTKAATQSTTKTTTQATTKATTQATTKATTQATTKAQPSASIDGIEAVNGQYWIQKTITIKNTGTVPINGWTLTLNFNNVKSIDEVKVNWSTVNLSGNKVNISPANIQSIPVGGEVSFIIAISFKDDKTVSVSSHKLTLN